MSWTEHAVFWHVYPLGLCGAPIRPERPEPVPVHRLRRLEGWLDHAVALGASALLLGPIHMSQTHGYDTLDALRLDPRLGTGEDFAALAAACHERGLHVVLDGVFSHAGQHHPELERALREGPDSPAAALFDIDWDAPGGPAPRVFEGHGSLARFDHSGQAARDYAVRVLTHWLDQGADGWRLDAAYSVPTGFWADVVGAVRRTHPDAWFLGEVIHGDYAGFVRATGMDTITQYELWKAIWSSLHDRNFFELDWTLRRHSELLDTFVPQTFVGNHDVTRIASLAGREGALVALTVLLTVGGIPSIYYGDEYGFTGVKEERLGGDDAVRPALPDSPGEVAPWGLDVLRAHQNLIGLRRRHPWLTTARTETVELTNTHYVYRAVAADASASLLVELDVAGTPSATVHSPQS